MLMKPEDVARRINAGATLFLAGDEALLAALPRGNWIGGSSPYFMDSNGGKHSRDLIFVQEQSTAVSATQIRWYAADALAGIAADSPGNGYSLVIIPATSPAHVRYAEDAPGYSGLFMKNIVGWIAGVDLNDLGKVLPRVFDGTTGESSSQAAAVLHATLPDNKLHRSVSSTAWNRATAIDCNSIMTALSSSNVSSMASRATSRNTWCKLRPTCGFHWWPTITAK